MSPRNPHILVAYASASGSTGEVAESIGTEIEDEQVQVTVRHVREVTNLSPFTAVILGSSIRTGRWLPDAVTWLETHHAALADRPVAFFTTCLTMAEDTPQNRQIVLDYLAPVLALVPDIVPVGLGLFAGSLYPGMQAVIPGSIPYGDFRDWQRIREWAGRIKPQLLAGRINQVELSRPSQPVENAAPLQELTTQSLSAAELEDVREEYTSWTEDDLPGADLAEADLHGVSLVGAGLGWTDLSAANLAGANLRRANLIGSSLQNAILDEANLSDAALNGADLCDASLVQAHLARADLNWAVLKRANLRGADLSQASLGWADFSQAQLEGANFTEARYNAHTSWPEGFSPETAGCIYVSGPH